MSTSATAHDGPDIAFMEWVEVYDQLLAQQDVPVHERPLRAAILFAKYTVVRVSHEGSEEAVGEDANIRDYFDRPWFGKLIRMIEDWYSKMFGPAALRPPERSLCGAVMHRGAIQVLQIPVTVTQEAELRHQLWIAFPDHVEEGEDVLSWVRPELDRSKMQQQALAGLEVQVRRIAGAIRFIASRARNASKGSAELSGLLAAAVRSLEEFPRVASLGHVERQRAWWELQMANECFLKAFCLQRARPGGYRKIHSLPILLRDARDLGLEYDPAQLSKWLSERDISEHRYGTGPGVRCRELFSAYEVTLSLCEAVASSLTVRLDTGKARFLIQPLPWPLRELGVAQR